MTNAKPRFSYIDHTLVSGATVSASQSEMIRPKEYLLNDTLSKGWSTPFQSITVVSGANDTLVFIFGKTSLSGTVTFTNGSASVTGAGTSFTTQAPVGSYIKRTSDGITFFTRVTQVISDTSLNLEVVYAGTSGTGGDVGTKYVATIQASQDLPGDAFGNNTAGRAEDAMNSIAGTTIIRVTYTAATGRFTFAATGATAFILLSATCGEANPAVTVNKQKSAWSSFGFDCSKDHKGALTYTAEYTLTSSWGTFAVWTGVNDTFQIKISLSGGGYVTYTVVVPQAVYNNASLRTAVKWKADVQAGDHWTDLYFDESTKIFHVVRRQQPGHTTDGYQIVHGGTFLTGASPAGVLGFSSGSDYTGVTPSLQTSAGTPSSYAADVRRIHTEEWWRIVIPVSQTPRVGAAFRGNTQSTATVQWLTNASSFNPADPSVTPGRTRNLTYNSYIYIDFDSAGIAYLCTVLKVIDRDNPDGYVWFGKFLSGDYLEVDTNDRYEATIGHQTRSTITETDGTNTIGVRRGRIAYRSYTLKFITESGLSSFNTLLDTVGDFKAFILTMDPTNNPALSSLWCLFDGGEPEPQRSKGPADGSPELWAYNIPFKVKGQK